MRRISQAIAAWAITRCTVWRNRAPHPLHVLGRGVLPGLLICLCACTETATLTPTALPTVSKPANATPSTTATLIPTRTLPAPVSPTLAVTQTATTIRADIVLSPAQHQQETTVKVGQIINIPGSPAFEWSVDYGDQVLLALTPREMMKQPGASGWFFRAIAPGSTAILLDSIPPPCPGGIPCSPMPISLVFPIRVVP